MTPIEYAFSLRRVCLDRVPSPEDVVALGGDPRRWLRYRAMIRRRIHDVLGQAFPRAGGVLGDAVFIELERRFFEAGALVSPSLRDVPGEFVAWLEHAGVNDAAALDLFRFEWTERAVAMAPDDAEGPLPPLSMERPVVVTRTARLLSLDHAVHRSTPGPDRPPPAPTRLCIHRDRASAEVRVLELSSVAYVLVAELGTGTRTLRDSVERAAAREGAVIDAPFVHALGDLLGDLSERGILLGAAGPLAAPAGAGPPC